MGEFQSGAWGKLPAAPAGTGIGKLFLSGLQRSHVFLLAFSFSFSARTRPATFCQTASHPFDIHLNSQYSITPVTLFKAPYKIVVLYSIVMIRVMRELDCASKESPRPSIIGGQRD
jgi:hypothetical protein